MTVDVVINIRYTKTTPVAPGKSVTTTENIEIRDTVEEAVVQGYVDSMTPVDTTAP